MEVRQKALDKKVEEHVASNTADSVKLHQMCEDIAAMRTEVKANSKKLDSIDVKVDAIEKKTHRHRYRQR